MLSRIRKIKPLIHHITNFVVMNDTANATLHVGALPVMAHAIEEVGNMAGMSGALLLNIGTLTSDFVDSMIVAGRKANESGIPIIFDPVGAGATDFRTKESLRLLNELHISIVRGNSGEIGALAGMGGKVKGVESVEGVNNPALVVRTMAGSRKTVVALTGKRDYISDGKRTLLVDNGHEMLSAITGTGCMATTIIAAFAAVEKDYLLAAAGGLSCIGFAGELAAKTARGPASFRTALLDSLYNMTPGQLAEGAKVAELD